MKKILFFLSILIPSYLHANCITSELILRMYDNSPFSLVLDNQVYGTPCNNFRMGNIVPGNHFIQIIGATGSYNQNLNNINNINNVIYRGQFFIPQASRVYLMVDAHGLLRVLNVVPFTSFFPNTPYNNFNFPLLNDDPLNNYVPYSKNRIISQESFDRLVLNLKDISADNMRLLAAKHAMFYNSVTSEQVATLVKLFSFDKDRLDLAKYAFNFTLDKENYYLVTNSFIFSATKQELKTFLFNYF